LNEALRNARELFAPIEAQFASAEALVKGKLLDYKRKVDEEARQEEAAIAKKVEQGRLKIETAEKKMEQVERVETTTRGKVGEVQIRKIKKVRIIKEALIPREYLVIDMVLLRKDVLAGKVVAGAELYEDESVSVGMF